jgi:predicted transcriptional regulator
MYHRIPYELSDNIIIAVFVFTILETNLSTEEVTVTGSRAIEVAEALTATTMKILQLLSKERLDVSTIGIRLDLSEAYISEQIRVLEELGLVKVSYERGKRGIRKVCETAIKKITILIKE